MRRVVLNNVEYLEEDRIYNPIKKESSYEEMGGTYELRKDYMLYPTFSIIEKRRKIKHENYGMLHIAYLKMEHIELYIDLEKENKLKTRQIEINNRAIKFKELETPRYIKAWEVTEELKLKDYSEWVELMNQINIIIEEQIKHMIVYSL
ncbi:MAG: TnpV protein [Peptoniphilaceae bacterium]